ncbi:MAG: BFD-like (2Fe-2S) protein [Deltaproteobacteria bacterium]|nr:MAG: BFD-like (2Fe-2S) protein [Deltaproteobacteria bacterium]RLB06652.1 MAG: BFD-like (2Fe-2S) protein [Deltaproteobacteria bacterium]HEC31504.1 BFD-like (2Fe-2S) protein [Deltaproteobacteria bacterium]
MSKLICYCWNYTDEDIRKDVFEHNGKSTIMEKIKAEKKAGNCQCEIKNPKGK